MSAAFIAYLVKMLDSLANFTLYAKLPGAMDEVLNQKSVSMQRFHGMTCIENMLEAICWAYLVAQRVVFLF